jgi:hypothetical protein
MRNKAHSRDPRGSDLTAATAEKVFGWKNVHKQNGDLIGKKQDKLRRWRTAKVPDYSETNRFGRTTLNVGMTTADGSDGLLLSFTFQVGPDF